MYSYFRNLLNKYKHLPEILFTGHHVTHLPWGVYDEWDDIPLLGNITELPLQNVHIRAKKLRHITYNKPAREIDRENQEYFEFKPACKVGKPFGGTYAIYEPINQRTPPTGKTEYQSVTSDEELFPGYYSWWSIDYDPPPSSDSPPSISDPSSSLERYYYFSQVFTSSSRYGNNKFSCYIKELLQCYQKAYNINPLPCVQLRYGGTLCYKQEICKGVIVCTNNHHPLPNNKFPVMWEGPPARIEEVGEVTLTITTSIEIWKL